MPAGGAAATLAAFAARARSAQALQPAPAVLTTDGPVGPVALATILLVEDDWQVRRLTERVLVRQGYRVLAAARGVDALEIADTSLAEVDLLLTDMLLPGVDGVTLARLLTRRRPGLPVLLVSGYADPRALTDGLRDLSGGFLQKPYSPDVLIERIRELLPGSPDPSTVASI